jgi:signal transduction histidine kinase
VLAASPGLEGPLPAIDPPVTGSRVTTVELPTSGESVRLLVREVDGVTLRLAGDLDDVGDSVGALGAGLLVAVPLSTAVLALVVWWAVGRALRPVDDIRRRVEEISGARLDQRVPEPGTGDEIARLARTMNAMLARLEESARRQRRFVSDAAHELRSPLARMRAELEVDQAHPATADPTGTADSVLAETVGLQHLVDDLLLLARGDEGVDGPPDAGPVDLDALVARAARRARPGEIRIDRSGVEPVQLHGSPAQLERVLTNLLDNAVRHAKQQVTVTVRAAPDGAAEVVVADDGPGIPDDQRERVFERFTRLDEARTAGEGGAGLGLAIAREIAERHGGSLALAPRGPGARFVLRLPAAGAARPGCRRISWPISPSRVREVWRSLKYASKSSEYDGQRLNYSGVRRYFVREANHEQRDVQLAAASGSGAYAAGDREGPRAQQQPGHAGRTPRAGRQQPVHELLPLTPSAAPRRVRPR